MSTDVKSLSTLPTKTDDDRIGILEFLLTLMNGWKTVLSFALIALIIGVLYSRYVDPVFQADALIQIDDKSQGISALGANISDLVSPDVSPAQTEAELIKSRMILEPVIDLLHLRIALKDPEINGFDKIKNNEKYTQINSPEGVLLNTEDGKIQISQFNVSQDYLNKPFTIKSATNGFVLSDGYDEFKGQLSQAHRFQGTDGVIQIQVNQLPSDGHPIKLVKQALHNTINIINNTLTVAELGKQTGIIQLSLTGANQQQTTLILKEIILSYIDRNESRGSEETTKTIDFMQTQIPLLKQKLQESEALFNKFREKYGTIDVGKEGELLITENGQIDAQLNELRLKKADLTTYYTEDHPLVLQINEQLQVLNNRKQEIKDTVGRLPEVQREFLTLSEDVGINREIYLTMLKNYEQLKIVKAGQIGFARIIDLPISTFKAIAPRKPLIIVLALLLGLLLGLLITLIKSLLKTMVKDPERLEAKAGIPVIATVPHSDIVSRLSKNKKSANRLLAYIDNSGLSYEAIKSLSTHLMFGLPFEQKSDQRAKVILVTSESPGIGKSFISANLAEVFSQLDKKVLIIDGDMRLGELHKLFNMDQENGLADYFSKENNSLQTSDNIASIVHPTAIENIDFIPRGQRPYNPTSLLASEKFGSLMKQLAAHYDYIIIDTPPVLAASDAIILSRYADNILMVARYGKSVEGQVVYAINQLAKANVHVDGIVLNDVQHGLMGKYNYHYTYAYSNAK